MIKEHEDRLLKFAAEDTVNTGFMSSPLTQSLLLGGLGYLGADYAYDALSNNGWQEQYINSIRDPQLREATRLKFKQERDNKRKWWRLGAGALGAALPMLNSRASLGEGWNKGQKTWGGPTAIDKAVSGASGTLAAAIGGQKALDNMGTEAAKSARDLSNFRKIPDDFDKHGSEKSYIYDNLDKEAGMSYDAFAGKDFRMPYVRPLSTNGFKDIPVASSIDLVQSPNNAAIMGHDVSNGIAGGLFHASDGKGAGLISTNGLIKGLTRAGFGAAVGAPLGSLLGTIFAQPPQVKEQLKWAGGIGGAILNSGIL